LKYPYIRGLGEKGEEVDKILFLFVFPIRKLSSLDPARLTFCPETYLLLSVISVRSLWIKYDRMPLAFVMSIIISAYNVRMLPSFAAWFALI